MDKYITYKKGQIDVTLPDSKDLVVYAHPTDKINLDFDISNLKSTIVNGDLVIESLSGHRVTIANYALMSMSGEAPKVSDGLGKLYTYNNFLSNIDITYTTDAPDSYVLDRKLSAPKSFNNNGEYLDTAESTLNKGGDRARLSGNIEVDEQNPVFSSEVVLSLYPIRTLYNASDYRYDVPITYDYAGKTLLQEEQDDSLPVEIIELKMQVDPLYGTSYDVEYIDNGSGSETIAINPIFGGGDLLGDENAVYQYTPETIDFSTATQDITYSAYTGDTVVRGLSISLSTTNTYITSIRIDDMPDEVTLISSDQSTVQDIGGGSYLITPTSSTSNVEVFMEYPLGMDPISQSISITVEGYNTKLESIVTSDATVTLEFNDVQDAGDVSNFTQFNTFTFSTSIDPLIVNLGTGNDTVYGDQASHTYNTGAGNDQVYSGSGSETVNLQEGDDIFYVGEGDDVVTADDGSDIIRFNHNKVDINQTVVTLQSGVVDIDVRYEDGSVAGSVDLSGFESIEFEDSQYVESLDQDNVIYIDSTEGLDGFVISMGGGDDAIYINSSATVNAEEYSIVTNADNNSDAVYYKDTGEGVVEKIYGSEENDTLIAGDYVSVDFDGQGGQDTADYGNLANGAIIYDSSDSTVTKETGSVDTVENFEVFYGTFYDDIFYASSYGSSEYYGYEKISSDYDIVSYENETEGVVIDYTQGDTIVVEKTAESGEQDTLVNIEEVIASQGDDTFIISNTTNGTFDGLSGVDTLDYSQSGSAVDIIVVDSTSDSATGSVQKDSFVDNYSNMERFIGTEYEDSVVVQDPTGSLYYDGGDGNDSIDYSQFSAGNEDVYIIYNFSDGNVQKYDDTGALVSQDEITSFEIITSTENNDTFILNSSSDLNQLYQVDGGGNEAVDVEDRSSTGDVLVLNYGSDDTIDLSLYNTVFANFESVVLGDFENTIAIDINSNTYVHIYGGTDIDTFDASNSSVPLFFTVSSEQIIVEDTSGNEITRLYDFEVIDGSYQDDYFTVSSDADSSWGFYGSTGSNTLDYSDTTVDLTVDIEEGTVDKEGGSGQDTFSDISIIYGGDGNDTFLVDSNSNTVIDGAGGDRNVVSFENSDVSLDLEDTELVGQYSNIQAFILTDNSDSITFVSTDTANDVAIDVEGGGGTDVVYIDDSISDVTYVIDSGVVTLDIGLDDGEEQLKDFEFLHGTAGDDNFTIMTIDNSDISSDGNLSFYGGDGNDTADFSAVSTGLNVTVGVTGLDYSDTSLSYISVQGQDSLDSTDYLRDIENVTLTEQDDTIYLNLISYTTTDLGNVSIDAGGGTDTLDFSEGSNGSIIFDIGANEVTYGAGVTADVSNVSNWEKTVGTTGDDTFIISDSNPDVAIDGNLGTDTVDYRDVSDSVTIDLINSTIVIGASGSPGEFANIENYILSDQNDTIIGDTAINITVDAAGGDSDTLDYSQADVSSLSYGYVFNIDGDSTLVIKDQLNSKYDSIDNAEIFVGTELDDTFNITSLPTNVLTLDGAGGRDTLNIDDSVLSGSEGLNYDLTAGELSTTSGSTILYISNIEVLSGSSNDDKFIIDSSTNFFDNQGVIDADEGYDEIDLTALDSSYGVYVSLQENKLYLYQNGSVVDDSYITVSGVETIMLGDGDDAIIYTSGGVNTDIEEVDGGGGDNYISFEELRYAIEDDITSIDVAGSITYTNFNDYKFTVYNDYITISDSSDSAGYNLDGYDGLDDTLDYSTYTASSVDIIIDTDGTTITRGGNEDDVINFEHFILTDNNDSVTIKVAGVYNIDGGAGNKDSLTYDIGGDAYMTMDFSSQSIYIFDSTGLVGYNQFSNIEEFTLTGNNDIVYIGDSTGDYTINGNGGSDIIDFSVSSTAVTYSETASGATADNTSAVYTLDSSFTQVIGSTQDDIFLLSGTISGTYFGGNGDDTLSFENSTEGATVDISAGTATVGSSNITFNSMEVFIGSDQDDSFTGLNNYSVYDIDGGDDVNGDNVSYDSCLTAITVTIDANGDVSIDKGLGTADSLKNIESYTGTNYDDIFTVDTAAIDGVILDGGVGYDTLILSGTVSVVDFSGGTLTVDGQIAEVTNFEEVDLTDDDETLNLELKANNYTAFNMAGGTNTLNVTSSGLGVLSMSYSLSDVNPQLAFITSSSNNTISGDLSTASITSDNDIDFRVSDVNFDSTASSSLDFNSDTNSSVYFSDYTNLDTIYVDSQYHESDDIFFNSKGDQNGITTTGVDTYYFLGTDRVTLDIVIGNGTPVDYDLFFSGAVDMTVDTNTPSDWDFYLTYDGNSLNLSNGQDTVTDVMNITIQDMTNSTFTDADGDDPLHIVIESDTDIDFFETITADNSLLIIDLSGYSGYLGDIVFSGDTISEYSVVLSFNSYSNTTVNYKLALDLVLRDNNDSILIEDLLALSDTTVDGSGGEDVINMQSMDETITFNIDGTIAWDGSNDTGEITNFEEIEFTDDTDDVYSTYGTDKGVTVNLSVGGANTWTTIILPELWNTDTLDSSTSGMADSMSLSTLDFSDASIESIDLIISFDTTDDRANDRLYNIDGTYTGSSGKNNIYAENVRQINGSSGDDTISFASLTFLQASSISYYLSDGNTVYDADVDSSSKLVFSGGAGEDTVNLSGLGASDHSAIGTDYDNDYFSYKVMFDGTDTINITTNNINGSDYAFNNMSQGYSFFSLQDVEVVFLPMSDVAIDNPSYDNDLTLVATKTSNPEDIVVLNSSDGNTTYTNVLDGEDGLTEGTYTGTGDTTYSRTYYNIPVLMFSSDTDDTIVIAQSGELYQSGMVELRMDGTDDYGAGDYGGGGNDSYDSVDFSNSDEGLTFTYGMWHTSAEAFYQEDTYNAANETGSGTFTGDITDSDYYDDVLQAEPSNTNSLDIGIIVTDSDDYFHLNDTDGYDQNIYYRLLGVEEITATSGNDTWVWGQALYNTNNTTLYNPERQSYDKGYTNLEVIDGAEGFDTIYMIGYNASTKSNGKDNELHQRDITFTYGLTDDASGTSLDIDQSGSGHSSYDPMTSNLEYKNFESYISDDYGYTSADMMVGNYYRGTDDDLIITIGNTDVFTEGPDVIEFDLGGRYFDDTTDVTSINNQKATVDITSLGDDAPARVSWLSEPSQDEAGWGVDQHGGVDSYVSIDLGYDYEYSTINIKNFDVLEVDGVSSDEGKATLSFNTDLDFTALNNKSFEIIMLDDSGGSVSTEVSLYSSYNYAWDASDSGLNSGDLILGEDADGDGNIDANGQSFTIHFSTGYTVNSTTSMGAGFYFDEDGQYIAPDGYEYYTSADGSIHLVDDNSPYLDYEAPEEETPAEIPDNVENTDNATNDTTDMDNHNLHDVLVNGGEEIHNFADNHDLNSANHSELSNTSDVLDDILSFTSSNVNHSLHNLEGELDNNIMDNFINSHDSSTNEISDTSQVDMNSLIAKLPSLVDNNQEGHDSLISTIQNINSLSEDMINQTQQEDEAGSLSFALDDMFSNSGDDHNSSLSTEGHSKSKSSGSHGSNA